MLTRRLIWLLALCACGGEETTEPDPPDGTFMEAEPHCQEHDDEALTLFHLQMKSTHNSYHLEPPDNDLQDWAYSHKPLDQQLASDGVRHFELDIRLEDDELVVYHLPVLDDNTTCATLHDCMSAIKSWSLDNPAHHTVFVHIEPKDGVPPEPEPYFTKLEQTITGVWSSQCVVKPDDVRGDHADLATAIAAGWPNLGATRGKLMLSLLDRDHWRNAYTRGEAELRGRLIFAEGPPGSPYAAVARGDHPVDDVFEIAEALAASMLVRTRADSGSEEAVAEDTTRLDAALASGAHMISTDFAAPVAEHNYSVDIPGGTPSRCNPVTAPAECTSAAIEDL